MNSRHLSLAFAATLATFCAIAQNTASIQGMAADSATGKAVPGTIIIASKAGSPATRGVATTSLDGSFQMPSLPAGTYSLCAQYPQDGYLATCHWGATASTVTLATAQKSTGNRIPLKAGSILKVSIADPKQLLTQKTKDGYLPDLVMGVWSNGSFYPTRTASKTATSASYQVTIPFDTQLNFTIQSRKLALGDSKGNPIAANADQQSFQHASAETTHVSFAYTILSALQ